jgi:hypothetical protein
MIASLEQIASLEEAAKPLIKFLNENWHPHCRVIVTRIGAEVVEGVCTIQNTEFLHDLPAPSKSKSHAKTPKRKSM